MLINIQDDIRHISSLGLLDAILVDMTTGKHIIWATSAYDALGDKYKVEQEITSDNCKVVENRAAKNSAEQYIRTRSNAEVFTPLWMCKNMNDQVDDSWFGYSGVFNVDGAPTKKVEFPEGKSWREYVLAQRLEVACGEAPFLTSRYDVSKGKIVEIENRAGFLDRKLRVVTENASSEIEWIEYALKSLQSVYGYELQGDSLLIARVNVLLTFEEYLEHIWNRKPTMEEYQRAVNIITWNLWQMDGLKYVVPFSCKPIVEETLFGQEFYECPGCAANQIDAHTGAYCKIKDWRANEVLEYVTLVKGGNK